MITQLILLNEIKHVDEPFTYKVIIIIIIIMTLFKEDYLVGQVQSSLRSSIKIHTFTIYTSEHPNVG